MTISVQKKHVCTAAQKTLASTKWVILVPDWIQMMVASGFCSADFSFFIIFFIQPVFIDFFYHEHYIYVLFTDSQISLFNNFFIKNEFYGTIYTFKNYFAIVFSVSTKINSIQMDLSTTTRDRTCSYGEL